MKPVASVLVLAYNHGEYLSDALDSILKQRTGFPFEVLVGEDNSDDATLAVARQYERANAGVVRVITDQRNVGMHENLRRLVRASRGDYVAFCEGDDYWNSCSKLADQVAILENDPGIGAVHTDFDHIRVIGGEWRALRRFWRRRKASIPVGRVFEPLLLQNFIQTCTLVVRRSLVTRYLTSGIDPTTYQIADWPLCLFVARSERIAYIDEPMATYRKVPGSATNQGVRADISRLRNQAQMGLDFCRWAQVPDSVRRSVIIANTRGLLHQAEVAADVELMGEAIDELKRNGYSFPGLRGKTHLALLATSAGRRVLKAIATRRAEDLRAYKWRPYPPKECLGR